MQARMAGPADMGGRTMKNLGGWVLVFIGAIGYNAYTSADRDSTGAIVGEGSVDAFDLRPGDCFNIADQWGGDSEGEVDSLPGVPCADPHENEVYATFDLTAQSLPSEDVMWEMAFDGCESRFESFVGKDYQSSSLDILTLHPTEDSWNLKNDREVVCAVYDMNGGTLTGSARGRGL